LQVIACWQSAGCRLAFEALKSSFKDKSARIHWRDIGFLSSEFRGTIPMASDISEGLPTYLDYFFEFIPLNQLDSITPKTFGLWELEQETKYSILVTSFNGLYRYFMNDIVQVKGQYHGVPLLTFIQKGKGVTSITGEKLYEAQFLEAVDEIKKTADHGTPGGAIIEAIALADIEKSKYLFIIELPQKMVSIGTKSSLNLASDLDLVIGKINIEYFEKRNSKRLGIPEVIFVKHGFFDETRLLLSKQNADGRDAQTKIIAVQYAHEFILPWENWRLK
jgi:hypothetical protein